MFLFRRFITNFSHLSKRRSPSRAILFSLTSRRFTISRHRQEKQFSGSAAKSEGGEEKEVPSSLFKYEPFSENTAPLILDVEEERQRIRTEETVLDEFEGISLERGITGVIEVEEVVELLRREKGQDIVVVRVPPEYNYADYKVFVTGISQRHMLAMTDFMRRLYKKRVCSDKQIPQLEGKKSKLWMAIDLGNIILHVFSVNGRQLYDLETLWSVGRDYDTITHRKSTSCQDITNYAEILASLNPSSSN